MTYIAGLFDAASVQGTKYQMNYKLQNGCQIKNEGIEQRQK